MDHSGGPPQMAPTRTVNDQSGGPGGYPPRDQRPGPSNQVSFDMHINLTVLDNIISSPVIIHPIVIMHVIIEIRWMLILKGTIIAMTDPAEVIATAIDVIHQVTIALDVDEIHVNIVDEELRLEKDHVTRTEWIICLQVHRSLVDLTIIQSVQVVAMLTTSSNSNRNKM